MEAATRVSFYLLQSTDPRARLLFACRLAEKAWHLGNRIHARTLDADSASELDDLLWTFRQGSFVPHALLPVAAEDLPPVTIGDEGQGIETPQADLLINLASDAPADCANWPRIAEIIDATPEGRELGRQRFRAYRQLGLEPETHTV